MKIFGVDTALKYIVFEYEGKEYSIHFKDNLVKGVHAVEVYQSALNNFQMAGKINVEVKRTYPPLKRIIYEFVRIHIPNWFKSNC